MLLAVAVEVVGEDEAQRLPMVDRQCIRHLFDDLEVRGLLRRAGERELAVFGEELLIRGKGDGRLLRVDGEDAGGHPGVGDADTASVGFGAGFGVDCGGVFLFAIGEVEPRNLDALPLGDDEPGCPVDLAAGERSGEEEQAEEGAESAHGGDQ